MLPKSPDVVRSSEKRYCAPCEWQKTMKQCFQPIYNTNDARQESGKRSVLEWDTVPQVSDLGSYAFQRLCVYGCITGQFVQIKLAIQMQEEHIV